MGQSLPNSVWFSLAFSYLNFTKGSVHFGGLLPCWAEGSHLPGHRESSIYLPFSSVEGRQQGVSVPHTSIPSFVSLSKWQLKLINPGNFHGRFFFPFMLGLSSNQSKHTLNHSRCRSRKTTKQKWRDTLMSLFPSASHWREGSWGMTDA